MKHKRIKPLAKVGFIFIALAFLALLSLAWIYGRSIPSPIEEKARVPSREIASAIDTDADQDGLKDWEETIFHTDPKNPDTDGDGTEDGEEVKQNRNPLKKGPGDTSPAAEETPDTIREAYGHLKKLSAEGNITQALVSQIINQNGLDSFLKPENSEETASALEAYLKKVKSVPAFSEDALSDASLAITSDTSAEAIKAYFNTIAKIYIKNILPLKTDDLTILQTALEKEDAAELNKIPSLITAVESTYQEIKNTAVPKSILLFHKKELFLLKSSREELVLVQSASLEDALYIALLMQMRIERKKQVSALHNSEIPLWLESKHIAFSAGDMAKVIYQKR